MRICVFCASSPNIDAVYFEATELLAKDFVKNSVEVVFGGGETGLMGKLADTMIEHGGKIQGIIPKFMFDLGWEHKSLSDLIITNTMHERKARYLLQIDGIVALPGGSGTLEELLEVITLKRLGLFSKPILILNTNGFYKSLKNMLEKCIDENFMHKNNLELWTFLDEPKDILMHFGNAESKE